MGPEVNDTALLIEDHHIHDMLAQYREDGIVDDDDGFYIHSQLAGQQIVFRRVVFANGEDDAIDTLDSDCTFEDMIIRDWDSPLDDSKGLSISGGEVFVRRNLIVNNTLGIAAKLLGTSSSIVHIDHSTIVDNGVGIEHNDDARVEFFITNSIIRGTVDSIADGGFPAAHQVSYSNIGEAFPGTGNQTADPLFRNAVAHNYRLQAASPAIDAGDPAFPLDPDGTRTDMGVFPFYHVAVTVAPLSTTDTTPPLSGTVNDPTASVQVTVAGNTYNATNNGNGTWTLADNAIAPPLTAGTYNVVATATNVDGSANDATANELTILPINASIAGRHLFYNQSFFDGNNAAATAGDDGAIDTTKSALLPGGTGSFANYSGYSLGLNGVMVDIAGTHGTISIDDFSIRVGNNNTPGTWAAGPSPTSVTLRAGAGVGGSDRYTLIFANNAIQKTWAQITVLANGDTNLAANDVFYFGNAIGEVGNSSGNAIVTAADEALIRTNFTTGFGTVPVTSPYDINKNRFVQASDAALARANQTTAFSALRLIVVPAAAGGGGGGSSDVDLSSLDSGLVDLLANARRRRR
jgi:hypothetical protein